VTGRQTAQRLSGACLEQEADALTPWTNRAGELSPLKLAVFAYTLVPGLWLAAQAAFGWLGSKPLTEAIHQSGDWAVRLLLLSLAITPLRFIGGWPQLILVRRMLGLSALAYVALHLVLYVALEAFDIAKVAREIVLRFYLTVGFIAFTGLVILGSTSTDGMIRRLGALRWNRLHRIVYGIALLALLHFALQRKIEVSEPALMMGFFLWLMGFRLLKRFGQGHGPLVLLGLAVFAGVATALVEFAWYATMTGVPAIRVLAANLDFSYTIRPAWWVLAAALALATLAMLRGQAASRRGGRLRTAENLAPQPVNPQ
jgi:methionine sulfoxide reductase heme-binding subunit